AEVVCGVARGAKHRTRADRHHAASGAARSPAASASDRPGSRLSAQPPLIGTEAVPTVPANPGAPPPSVAGSGIPVPQLRGIFGVSSNEARSPSQESKGATMNNASLKGVIVGCVLLLGAGCVWAQDWPQWRGPNRDNKVMGFTEPTTWPKELTKKWKVTVG